MAAVSCKLSEDQLLCSICLKVLTDTVTTPCGHSYCKTCINKHWDNQDQCLCPVCKEDFNIRPQLKINTFTSEMVSQFKSKPQEEDNIVSSEQKTVKPGEVPCDICSETKQKALKSCLVCLASYCETHLEPHMTIHRLKRHQLIDPVENLEDRICTEHDKPLELFCRTDMKFICLQCTLSDHKSHDSVLLIEQCKEMQAELRQIIKERQMKMEELQRSVEVSQTNADREMAEGLRVFTALMECVQKSLDQFKQDIQEKQNKNVERAADLIKELEKEISVLQKRHSEMEELSEDHLDLIQTFTSVKPAPVVKDWTEVTVRCLSYEGTVMNTVSNLENNVLSQEIKKVYVAELKRLQQYAVDVTLDPETAHPNLVLSYSNKRVHYSDNRKDLPNNPERFVCKSYVFGEQKCSSGRFYVEVEVKQKTAWVLGVAHKSIRRKEINPLYAQDGVWLIYRSSDNLYRAAAGSSFILNLKSDPEKVGVFVDYEEGLISFYDVHTASPIHSFTNCCFTVDLLSLFNPCGNDYGKNTAPLTITHV